MAKIVKVLGRNEHYTEIQIPHQQHTIDSLARKEPAISVRDIYEPFRELAGIA